MNSIIPSTRVGKLAVLARLLGMFVVSFSAIWVLGRSCMFVANHVLPLVGAGFVYRAFAGLGFSFSFPLFALILSVMSTISWAIAKAFGNVKIVACIVVLGIIALCWVSSWAANPVVLFPMSFLGDHSLSFLVKKTFLCYLITPEWFAFTDRDEAITQWTVAEAGARLFVVGLVWSLCATVIVMWIRPTNPPADGKR